MTRYDETFTLPIAFAPQSLANTLGEVAARAGLKQLRMAETEKYPHVTFFFNGGIEEPNADEDRCMAPSPKVATYDLKPSMSAHELTDELLKRLESDVYDMVILNFANPDMVGHTGDIKAATEAVEVVDQLTGKILDQIEKLGGVALVTADHGNAEGKRQAPHRAHDQPRLAFRIRDRPRTIQDQPRHSRRHCSHHASSHGRRTTRRNDRQKPRRTCLKI